MGLLLVLVTEMDSAGKLQTTYTDLDSIPSRKEAYRRSQP